MKSPVEKLHSEYIRIFKDLMVIPEYIEEMNNIFESLKEIEKKEYIRAFIIGERNHYSCENIKSEDYFYYRFIREMF